MYMMTARFASKTDSDLPTDLTTKLPQDEFHI